MNTVNLSYIADIFPTKPKSKRPIKRYGMIQDVNRFTGLPQDGCYSTPDGMGHVEREGRKWHVWRNDIPGVMAHYDTLKEAAQYAHYGN